MGRKFLFRMILSLLFVAMGVTASFAQTSLYVSSDYNSSTEGYGTTKFSNYAGAYAYATANAKTTATIVIEKTNTLSGNTFDNNHKNYSKLAVVIKDGATMGNALSKWDMTYPVTVEPGGTLTCARPASASVSNIHIKNKLIVGAKGATKKAVVDFLSDSYQDCDISIRYNGSIEVYNADFYVQDLDAQGKLTIEDSKVEVDGAFASATSTFYPTTLTNSTITINGNQISGGLSDFSGGTSNQLGNVKINNSTLTIKEGTTKVAANVTATNSTIAVNDLTVNSGKTLNLNEGSTLEAENITTAGTGSVKIDGVQVPVVDGAIVVPVADFAALKAAVEAGKNVQFTADITTSAAITTSGVTSVVDLNGKTLTIGAGDNQFNDESNITIKNGDINITGVTVGGNAIFRLDEYEKTLVTTMTLENVNLVGNGYSSAYGIFYIGSSSVLNVIGGEWNLKNDTYTDGGVFKADASAATLNIEGTKITAHNVRRFVTYAATEINNATIALSGDADEVDAEMEHGFNRSPLAISNSTITMTDMVGRGITAEKGAVTIANSSVTMTNVQEATIDVRGNQTVTIDSESTVTLDKEPTVTSGTITGNVIVDASVGKVAKIGDTYYKTLQEAIDACEGENNLITLLNDITFESDLNNAGKGYFNIADGKKVVLDMNGKTINVTDKSTGNFIFFYNYGEFTVANGTINLTSTNNREWNAESAIFLNRGGIFNIENGIYTHNGGTDMAFVVDNSGNYYGDATTNIYERTLQRNTVETTLTSSYIAIRNRMEQNTHGASGEAILNVYGGTISGTSRAIWAQAASTSETAPATGEINVKGGNIGLIDTPRSTGAVSMTTISGGEVSAFKGEAGELTVTGGTLNEVTLLTAAGEAVNDYAVNKDGLYVQAVAKIGETSYETLQAAVDAVQNGQTITLLADAAEDVTIPAGVTFNGNGKAVGNITAAGTITFNGHTKATSFNVENTNTTINIVEGACLEITGSSRMVIGHGCTFNITGSIEDAKTADKAALTPSLIMPGASFTGAGVTFNVTNAYIKTTASYCSSSKSASSTFDFDIENSIWEQFGKLAFESQSVNATVNFDLVNSVLTTTSHLVFGVSRGEVVIDNSNVNVGTSRQIENQSTMTVKNGSVVNGAVATSSNAINPGTIIVENATYAVTGEFSGAAVGTGKLIIKKGANVSVGSIKAGANVVVDAEGMAAGDEINFTADLSQFTGTLSVINNDNLEAKIVDGKIVLVVKPVAKIGDVEYTTLEDAFKAATSGSVIEFLSDVTVDYDWDCRNTGSKFTVPVTINGNDKTIKFTGAIDDKNWNTVFRFEEEATVNNLTVNIEGATTVQRVITAKKSLNVDDLTIVGNSRYGIIFGEGASAEDLAATEIVIKNSALNGTRRAVSDNEGGKDVKSVVIEGNNLTANVYVSASESIVFKNNTTTSEVDLRSYAADNVLSVEAKDNELNEEVKNYIYAKNIDAQEEFTTENPPLKVSTKAELNAAINAANDGDVIEMTADIDYGTEQLKIEKPITLDLGGKTLTTRNAFGGMSIKNNPTIKNGNIVHASNTAAIKVWNATAFEDLVIDVQGKGDANKTIGGIVLQSGSTTRVGSIKNVTIKGDALTNGIETYNCGDATENVIGSMENVNIDAVGTAMLISAPCGTATNCTFDGGVNGIEIWIKGNYSASLELVDCDVVGGVFAHDEFSSNPEIVNNGTLNLTADVATEGAGVDDVTLTLARVEAENVEGVLVVVMEQAKAKVNNTYYQTLEAAVNAAKDGEEIDLLKDVKLTSTLLLTKNNILDGNGFKLTPAEGGFTPDGNAAVIVLAANMSGYEANRTYTVKNLTIEGFSTPSRIVRANFCDATIQNCIFDDNASASIITSAYAVLNVEDNTFTNNTASFAVINVGSDVSDGTNLVAKIIDNTFENNEAAIAGIFLASSADVTGNHFKDNTHTGDNANAAAILAGPYTGNMAYTVNINSNAFENAMSKDGTALPSVFAEDWSSLGSTTSFDLSLNYWDGNEPEAGTAYKTCGDNPQVTVKSYYKTYEGEPKTLGGLVEYPQGNDFTGYTRGDAIWGEVWGNAKESFVIKVLDANGNVMGTTSLNNIGGIIDGDVNVTWSLMLDAASNTDEYWTMAWTTAPTIDNMPAKVELWVDGVKVSGGNVVLNGPDEIAKIYAAVTDASGTILGYHTDIQEAIKAAAAVTSVARTATAGTVEVLSDVTVDKWVMFAEKMSIGDGSLITLNINGVTIDGNGKTLTIKSIESASNGGYLFYDAQNLTVKDLTINIADGLVGGIGLQSGTISNVTFNGGQYAVLPGKNGVTIDGCTFNDTKGYAIYYEDARPGIVVDGNTFNTAEGKYAITMRSDEQFTNNTITKGRVNLANSAASTVSGNDFGTERFKVYNGATATISDNEINNLVFNETDVPTESTFTNNTLSPEAQAAIDALPAIAGEGTEANPYLIDNVDDLVWLQEKVDELAQDGSTQFAGKYFKLTNDIDLSGINWNPIGTMNGDHGSFKGVFDGGDHTISNLHVEQAGNGIGLFARTTGNAVIKNLKLNNVTVKSTNNSNYVGGLVGNAYASTKIENVHVSGNVYISGRGYIGGIAGHGYVVMDNVSVVATGDGLGNAKGLITSTFWCAGGVLGYAGEGATNIMNAHVENVVVTSAAGGLGAIVGMAEDNNGTQPISGSNLSAENVEIKTYTGAYGDTYANYALGYLYGGNPTSILTGDLSVDNVIITTSNGVDPEVTDAVAQIGNSIYFNLQAALDAGGNVTVLRDIALTEGVTVAADKTVVLDLNGKTITGTPAEAKAFAVITNKGDLTITDGTETEGKIVCDHKLAGSTGYAVNTITNSGTLTIVAGTIQNTSTASNQIGYAIDNNSTTGNTILVIEGGKVTASGSNYYDGIRQFCNSTTLENSVTIEGGEVSSLWLQNPSDGSGTQNTKDVKGSFAINGGTLNNLYLEPSTQFAGAIIGGHVGNISRFQTAEGRDLEGFISGGTFSSDVSEFCAKGFVCNDNGDGTYGVVEKSAVAKIDDVEYKYIQDAIDAANATDVINVVSSTTENITIQEGANITLEFDEDITLNGYFAPFRGNLTIKGGTINNTNSGASAIEINSGKLNLENVNIASARHAVRIDGAVTATINGGEYTLTATSGTRHAVNVSDGAEVTIKAGTFVGPKGTTMDSGSAVCVQAGAKVTIEGGDFSNGKNATLGVTGTMIVTGGTFDQDPSAYLAQGYITKYNETTSRYEVFKGVAKIENEYFASIQDAIDAAQNNDVITVISDFEMDITSGETNSSGHYVLANVANKAVVIDLNGKKVTVDVTNLPEGCKDNMLMSVFCADTDGNLTLKDSSNGNGSVSVTGGESKTVYSLVIAYGGLVNIEGGNYSVDYMPAGRGMIYGNVSDHSGADGSNVSKGVNISGGNFTLGNVGTLANGSPWILATAGSNTGKYIFVTGGTYNADILHQHWIFEVVAPTNKALKNNGNGTYTIVDAVAFVKHHEYDGYYSEIGYATLEEAFEIAETGDVVTLVTNVELENTITVNAGKEVILDLNGKTISGVCNSGQGHMFMVQNTADLTVKDSSENEEGKITYSRGTSNTGWVIDLEGDLILESGTIELTGDSWSIGYVVDVRPNSWGSEYTEATTFTMSGGKLVSSDAAVRVASSSADNHENVSANFIMNGGEIEAAWDGIFVQQSNAAYDILNVRINGGNIKSAYSPLRLYGPAATSVLNNVENPITLNITGGTFDYTGDDLENNKWLVPGVIMVSGGATFEQMLEYTDFEITGGTFEGDVNAYCAEGFAATNNDNGTWTVMPAQEQHLVAGWNWYSTYIDINGAQGLTKIENALGTDGIEILSHLDGWRLYEDDEWYGELAGTDVKKMYKIEVGDGGVDMRIAGNIVDFTNETIEIVDGFNWISYPFNQPMNLNDALSGFTPAEGDYIISHFNFAFYYDNQWEGSLESFTPGEGYIYERHGSNTDLLYNVSNTRGAVKANVTTEGNNWVPNGRLYPNNMTMIAVVDGLANGNYEVAAFVNGEVRGSARPIYVEALDAYMLFLTIHGDEVEEMSFRLYDIDNDTEYDLSDRINYSNNAHLGSVNEPYVFSRGTTGIGEASMSEVNIYPNPTTTGTEINLEATCDKVEVFNALGVKVAEYQNVDSIDALETAGIYVIRITNNGNVQNCRLVVK